MQKSVCKIDKTNMNFDANFDANFNASFDQIDEIVKIDESDQTESFDQSDDFLLN